MNTPGRRRPFAVFFTQLGRRGRAGAADYFYQILIVIIGVYLGITFESIASEHDRAKKARAALVQLVGDMKRDDIDMSRVSEAQQSQARDYSEIAQWLVNAPTAPSVRIDSLLEKVITSSTVYPRRGLYASMIAAGQLSLLPEDLSGSIVNLYENVYTRLAAKRRTVRLSGGTGLLPGLYTSLGSITAVADNAGSNRTHTLSQHGANHGGLEQLLRESRV